MNSYCKSSVLYELNLVDTCLKVWFVVSCSSVNQNHLHDAESSTWINTGSLA